MATTRHGNYGGARQPYGSFSGKAEAVTFPVNAIHAKAGIYRPHASGGRYRPHMAGGVYRPQNTGGRVS